MSKSLSNLKESLPSFSLNFDYRSKGSTFPTKPLNNTTKSHKNPAKTLSQKAFAANQIIKSQFLSIIAIIKLYLINFRRHLDQASHCFSNKQPEMPFSIQFSVFFSLYCCCLRKKKTFQKKYNTGNNKF